MAMAPGGFVIAYALREAEAGAILKATF